MKALPRRPARRAAVVAGALIVVLALLAKPCRAAAPPDSAALPGPAAARVEDNAFPVVLGSFSTTLVGSVPTRTQNILLAARSLDGIVLQPGDVLSLNRALGPRTAERGYLVAPVILREARQLQLGGGICQLASTAFVAALLSGLSATERHRHSSPVDYIPLGQDATISWGAKDLKIANVLEQRVRVRAAVLGSTLTVRFEGDSPLEGVFDLESVVREGEESLAGAPSREIEVYRVRRIDGREAEREFLHRDVYPAAQVRPSGVGS